MDDFEDDNAGDISNDELVKFYKCWKTCNQVLNTMIIQY